MPITLNGTTGITTPGLTNTGSETISSGTANGVTYLNGSKVLTSGSALVFDGSNLGVGVTPSAWSGRLAVQVNSSSFVGASDRLQLYQNSYFDGSAFKYIGSTFASLYNQVSGQHIWFTAPSGTAGNSITFTQAMTLDASGNLGIGTSSPRGKLDVDNIYIGTAGATHGFIRSADGVVIDTDYDNSGGDGFFEIRNSGSTRLYIADGGNLGIGTASPVTLKSATTLQVNGNAKLGNANGAGLLSLGDIASTGANCGIWRGAAGAYGSTGNYLCLGGYDGITFTTGNAEIASQTERMRLDASGYLTVGTTTNGEFGVIVAGGAKALSAGIPQYQFQAQDTTAMAAGVGGAINFTGKYTSGGSITSFASIEASKENATSGQFGAAMVFKTRVDGGGQIERARFNSTGAFVLAGGTTTANGIGITFPATQSASSDANTLDDYEEGTWTPVDSSGASLTFSASGARYIKIGKLVQFWFRVQYPTTSNGSNAKIGGLPYTGAATTGSLDVAGGWSNNLSQNYSDSYNGYVEVNTTAFYVYSVVSSQTTQKTNANLTGVNIYGYGSYYTAS